MNPLFLKNFLKLLPPVKNAMKIDMPKSKYSDRIITQQIVLITKNNHDWHKENFKINKLHYPWGIRFISLRMADFVHNKGAKFFCNVSVTDIKKHRLLEFDPDPKNPEEKLNLDDLIVYPLRHNFNVPYSNHDKYARIKYYIVQESDFIEDLENWTNMFTPSLLVKTNTFFIKEPTEYKSAITKNLYNAMAYTSLWFLLSSKKKDFHDLKIKERDFLHKIKSVDCTDSKIFSRKYNTLNFLSIKNSIMDLLEKPSENPTYEKFKEFIQYDDKEKIFILIDSADSKSFLVDLLPREIVINLYIKWNLESIFFQDEELREQQYIENKKLLLEEQNTNIVKLLERSKKRIERKIKFSSLMIFLLSKYFFIGYILTKIAIKIAVLYIIAKKYGTKILPLIADK